MCQLGPAAQALPSSSVMRLSRKPAGLLAMLVSLSNAEVLPADGIAARVSPAEHVQDTSRDVITHMTADGNAVAARIRAYETTGAVQV